jgi:hypothetical protein
MNVNVFNHYLFVFLPFRILIAKQLVFSEKSNGLLIFNNFIFLYKKDKTQNSLNFGHFLPMAKQKKTCVLFLISIQKCYVKVNNMYFLFDLFILKKNFF